MTLKGQCADPIEFQWNSRLRSLRIVSVCGEECTRSRRRRDAVLRQPPCRQAQSQVPDRRVFGLRSFRPGRHHPVGGRLNPAEPQVLTISHARIRERMSGTRNGKDILIRHRSGHQVSALARANEPFDRTKGYWDLRSPGRDGRMFAPVRRFSRVFP